MAVIIRIPTPLRSFTGGNSEVEVEGANVSAAIDDLESKCPGIKAKLYDDSGSIRKFLNVYLNDEDIRFMDGVDTELRDGDSVSLVPAIAGGI